MKLESELDIPHVDARSAQNRRRVQHRVPCYNSPACPRCSSYQTIEFPPLHRATGLNRHCQRNRRLEKLRLPKSSTSKVLRRARATRAENETRWQWQELSVLFGNGDIGRGARREAQRPGREECVSCENVAIWAESKRKMGNLLVQLDRTCAEINAAKAYVMG